MYRHPWWLQGGYKMLKKMKAVVGFSFLVSIFVVLGIMFASCSSNSLANSMWRDTGGTRTVHFGKTSVTWQREDTGFDKIGVYTISKDTVILSFDDGSKWTGAYIDGKLSIMANVGFLDEQRVEFHRIR
jgi:hypothetical protein